MSTWPLCLAAAALVAAAGCGTLAAQDEPAVIAPATAQTRTELARVVSAAMNGQPVTLAADAFTRDSVLSIERRTPAGPQGRAATGRTLEAPLTFRLVLRDGECLLVRDSDKHEWRLAAVRCVAATH